MVRRSILIACASLLALPVAARAAVGPRASAQLNRCHPSLDAAQRYAVFSGSMRSISRRTFSSGARPCSSISARGMPAE